VVAAKRRRRRLSKSRFTKGLQCHKRLWWEVHEADAPELRVDPLLRSVFERGHRVGDLARSYVPGGVLIELDHRQRKKAVKATREAIEGGANVIYEAAFEHDEVYCAVDILERQGDAWVLTEVKSTTRVKEQDIPDVAIQTHVAKGAGLEIARSELMHLDRECRYPHLEHLFAREDVTQAVAEILQRIPAEIEAQLAVVNGPIPEVEPGPHCSTPNECPFRKRCWPDPPEHHVGELYKARPEKVAELEAEGAQTIDQIPDGEGLTEIQARQHAAVCSGDVIVEPGLATALDLAQPVGFLDFETISPAIPVWDGCRPFDAVPVQLSMHIEQPDGSVTHHAWIARGSEDPRPALVEDLLESTKTASTVLCWHAPFEIARIRELAEALPERAEALSDLAGRIVDLLPIVRKNVYHPEFHGSFSLKQVLPALVPELGYDDLEVSEGSMASVHLERLLLEPERFSNRERHLLREHLLRYCERDTFALVRLLDRLRRLAGRV
jgi:hypothetical protein